MDLEVSQILSLLLAVLFGSIIGTERDIFNKGQEKKGEKISFGGIRTFSLISLFGGISVILDKLLNTNLIIIISAIIIGTFTLVSYIYSVFKKEQLGMTTEIAVFLTFFIGVFVLNDKIKFAIIITIVVSFILSLKEFLEKIKEKVSREEVGNTLKFAIISLVVLPLLPNEKYSLIEVFKYFGYSGSDFNLKFLSIDFFNPYGIWYFVVLMSAISYIGYILSKFMGRKNSIVVSGSIGGLISSTAVTASMTEKSKEDLSNRNSYVIATLLASSIMFVRVIIIVLFFNIKMLNFIFLPAFLMLLGMGAYIYYIYRKNRNTPKVENDNFAKKIRNNKEWKGRLISKVIKLKEKKEKEEKKSKYQSPFTIGPAIKFAFFVLFIKFVAAVGSEYKDIWGNYFYYALGLISGLADVDAVSQTVAVGAQEGKILGKVASMTIIIAVISNNLVKGTLAWRFGEKNFGKTVIGGFIFSMIFGLLGLFFI